ncbi:hypothetical protein VP01_171g4 [Puccinia sorghi]|uniref:Uncharacterized protein n=1 Tax=Puccinia sorghi TaxID=27349 RepID=A0A0L6VFC9_9BASI|nr:hypothetical protein VP01_171g4 [Puccinia sorghi]
MNDDEAYRSEQPDQSNKKGEGIDLTQTSNGSDSNEFYENGDKGGLDKEEEHDRFLVRGSGEEESGENNDEDE